MNYYKDLSRFQNTQQEGYYSIGWLHPAKNFPTGEVNNELVSKLAQCIEREKVFLMRSGASCFLVPCNGKPAEVKVDTKNSILLSNHQIVSCEVWVPSHDFSKIYIAPSKIIHYILSHNYLPPKQFIDAVIAFDLTSTWSGSSEREKFTLQNQHI